MNKPILMSIPPYSIMEIYNNRKTIEVRKRFPKDFRGWVYSYCTKNKPYLFNDVRPMEDIDEYGNPTGQYYDYDCGFETDDTDFNRDYLNGKVIGRFYVDNVEDLVNPIFPQESFVTLTITYEMLLKFSCLNKNELDNYIPKGKYGYAIHISKVETFDKPKELSSFYHKCDGKCDECEYFYEENNPSTGHNIECCSPIECSKPLTRPPRSWCYIEELEEKR